MGFNETKNNSGLRGVYIIGQTMEDSFHILTAIHKIEKFSIALLFNNGQVSI
jgi:hypothetical protein